MIFCVQNDDFCVQNDDVCIKNDNFRIIMRFLRLLREEVELIGLLGDKIHHI